MIREHPSRTQQSARKPCRAAVRCFAGLLLLLLAAGPGPGYGQPTDDRWRQRNDRGNRHEGLIDKPVGGPDLLPLSFVGWRETFTSDVDWWVRYFLPESSQLRVFGRELTDRHHYWMESKEVRGEGGCWDEWGPWPTGDVILKEKIPAVNLGILVQPEGDQGGELVLIPAFVYHSSLPESVSHYIFVLAPGRKLRQVSWELLRLDDPLAAPLRAGTLPGTREPGLPIAMRLPIQDLEAGWMKVLVSGVMPNRRDPVALSFRFFHQPEGLTDDQGTARGGGFAR